MVDFKNVSMTQVSEVLRMLAILATSANANESLLRWMDGLADLLRIGDVTVQELNAIKAQIAVMIKEDREPTNEEWDVLKQRSDTAHDTIQSVDLSSSDENTGSDDDGSDETGD